MRFCSGCGGAGDAWQFSRMNCREVHKRVPARLLTWALRPPQRVLLARQDCPPVTAVAASGARRFECGEVGSDHKFDSAFRLVSTSGTTCRVSGDSAPVGRRRCMRLAARRRIVKALALTATEDFTLRVRRNRTSSSPAPYGPSGWLGPYYFLRPSMKAEDY